MALGSSARGGKPAACILTGGRFATPYAKTAHGLVRGTERYHVAAVVDATSAGKDAGEVLDGSPREIPIVASVSDAVAAAVNGDSQLEFGIIGVATSGGRLPPDMRADVLELVRSGVSVVNGLHQLLSEDAEIAQAARQHGAKIIDLRKPRPSAELHFWTGDVLKLAVPRVAVLGTDCAIGKRTTTWLLREECRRRGTAAEMIYTGQTGWLQGIEHGFILDSTMNDFVSGELERAVLACAAASSPDLILLEGQSALRNPSGPCGAELLISGGTAGVILQHAPGREYFEDLEQAGCRVPAVAEEVELVRLYGSEVWAVCVSEHEMRRDEAEATRESLEVELGLPVFLPLRDGVGGVVEVIERKIGKGG